MIDLYYKVAMNEWLIVALACGPLRQSECAEVTIPYRDRDGKIYGITCYLLGVPHNHLVIGQMMEMAPFARLLARCGGSDEQFENVAALYMHGGTEAVPGIMEFARPQDFATRGLHDETPGWAYHLINYIVMRDLDHDNMRLRAGTSYLVNAWVDVPMDDAEAINQFSAVFHMMSMRGAPGHVNPMRPTDCLREDDFWDTEKLGEPPVGCPEEW